MKRKLNILLYTETSGPGGAETVLLNTAINLDGNQFNPAVVLHRSRWLHEQLSKHNVNTSIIPSNRSWDISFLRKLVKKCRQLKIDLIHSHLPGANLYACIAGMILRIPVIATFHNQMVMPGRYERHNALKHILIRSLAAKSVFVADYMKEEYIRKAKFPPSKTITIYNGIDLGSKEPDFDISALRKNLDIQDNELVVGNVANLRAPKGHHYLIDAAGEVCKNLPQTKFFLIGEGEGPLRDEIEDHIARLHLEDNVKLLGFRDDVYKLLHILDVFVLSSISEGLPLSVVEGMAASNPVVATDVGGLSEIVVHGQSGYLVEPRNSAALAEKILLLLQNKDIRETMGRKGREIAMNKFSLKAMIDNYQNLYHELVS